MGRLAGLAAIAVIWAGCATTSQSPRYYTLDMQPSEAAVSSCNLKIARIRVTDALAERRILIKRTSTEMEYYALDRWVAGLDELITEKLQAEFGEPRTDRPTLSLSGTLRAFEQVDTPDGAKAHVKLELSFRDQAARSYEKPLLEKVYETETPALAPNPSNVVQALSRALEEISGEIVRDAAALGL